MENELKCCPFCGGEAEIEGGNALYWARCKKCRVETKGFHYKWMAIEAWNRRYEPRQGIEFDYGAED